LATQDAMFATMKFLFLFLAFYLLCLSCIPCSDSKECNVSSVVEISPLNNHQEHNHSNEVCTPFCTCSCCSVSAFYSPFNKVQFVKIDFQSEKYPLHNENFNSEVSYSIWQPPKLNA
jgi:hypothetical protein